MGIKRKRINVALVLCAAIILNCMAWFGNGITPKTAKAAEVQELALPEGGLEQLNAYEITEEEAAKVPSYGVQVTMVIASLTVNRRHFMTHWKLH